MNLIKNIPYLIIAFLIAVIIFKDCGGGQGSEVKTDTVTVTKIDTIYKEVKGRAVSNPIIITVTDTINHYITQTEACDKPHLNDKGINLIKHRTYADTVQIKGYFIGYNASVLGELQGIELSLNGNVPQVTRSTVKTITNDVTKYRTIGVYAGFNRSPIVGLQYSNRNLSYSLNYDLKYKSVGVQVGWNMVRW